MKMTRDNTNHYYSFVVITADKFEHKYILQCLENVLQANLAGVVVTNKRTHGITGLGFKNITRRYSPVRIIERALTKAIRKILRFHKRQENAFKKVFGDISITNNKNTPRIYVDNVNDNKSFYWIKDINPDFIFVYGTGLVRNKVLSLARIRALNLHTGVSPYYRGSDTFFWALYNGEPSLVGITVHECTSKLDGGEIYATANAKLEVSDDPFIAFARSVKIGGVIYAEIAQRLADGTPLIGEKQDFSLGKEYRFSDRTLIQDIRMEYLIRTGKIKYIISKL